MTAFDLNVERVLEHWTVAHALRELIANALDESSLTKTAEPQIHKDGDGRWHVRDFGRGLRYENLTQKEDREKLRHPQLVVGKFGVGLKDAFACFDRRGADVVIRSRHADMTLARLPKHGFDDITTLHVVVDLPSDSALVGTDVAVAGIRDEDVEAAKALFLRYSGDEVLERATFGAVLRRAKGRPARIYVNGLRVAEEERFLFSYDMLERALGALTADLNTAQNYAERASSEAGGGTATLADVRSALEEVKTEAAVTPMDDYQQGTVCYQLGGVDYAKGERHLPHRRGSEPRVARG